jgi:hypothetical protein
MSGTGFVDEDYVKTAVCEKCGELKTWNYWYHWNPNLCDDCYYFHRTEGDKNENKIDAG